MSNAVPDARPCSCKEEAERMDMFDTSPAAIQRLLDDCEAVQRLFKAYEKLIQDKGCCDERPFITHRADP